MFPFQFAKISKNSDSSKDISTKFTEIYFLAIYFPSNQFTCICNKKKVKSSFAPDLDLFLLPEINTI